MTLTRSLCCFEQLHRYENQPYDESLDAGEAEDVASFYEPTPRVRGGAGGSTAFPAFVVIPLLIALLKLTVYIASLTSASSQFYCRHDKQ